MIQNEMKINNEIESMLLKKLNLNILIYKIQINLANFQ